ncbi:magnesium chelatase subunit H [Lutispora saccharofermentans]|uniref:Magnesium chelatase subunit H n=1 Tax=Lutispora saccharofermentans TaxID=3024236 RepID=A0ABT1NAT6_9FIRM|nr:magnesium chelatase subunit H [Lutispora saccharofermentans]MCQ1528365.1 magnesium chelatase subunit H [Lutispora saccharofermentans]
MYKITVIAVSNAMIEDLASFYGSFKEEYGQILDLKVYFAYLSMDNEKLEQMEKDIESSDFVIIDLMGAASLVIERTLDSLERCKGCILPIGSGGKEYLRLGSLNWDDFSKGGMAQKDPSKKKAASMEAVQKMMDAAEIAGKMLPIGKLRDIKNFIQIGRYWRNAGLEEVKNMMLLILRDYGNVKGLPKPDAAREWEDFGIYDPVGERYFDDFNDYRKSYSIAEEKPLIAVLFYGHNYPNRIRECVGDIVNKLGSFSNVLPIAFNKTNITDIKKLERILKEAAERKPDIIINLMSFRLGAGPMGGDAEAAVELLRDIGAPVFHPFLMTKKKEEEWLSSPSGLNPSEFLISVMLPELDGCIETYPVGALANCGRSEELDVELNKLRIIDERLNKLTSRLQNWIKLQKKENEHKRLAIVCYNYPPGEANIFGGAFLDTFKSVDNILRNLKEADYDIGSYESGELMEHFTAGGIVNSGVWANEESEKHVITYPTPAYEKDFGKMRERNEMIEQWGAVPGEIMTNREGFMIPGIIKGNIFIGLQPTRGIHENPDKAYHDKKLLPHHQYLAYYKWLQEEFKADAIIHVGTHGTLEFLKGKECGMSGECFPDRLVGNMPHIYLYYCGNPAEAMIAKRRSHAVLVGYQPPVFVEGELYGELAEIQALTDEYREAQRASPARCDAILANIKEKAEKNNMNGDLDALEKELYRIGQSLIPRGLHIFGEAYDEEEAKDYAMAVAGYDRGECKSLRRIMAEEEGMDYDEVLKNNDVSALKIFDAKAKKAVEEYLSKGLEKGAHSPEDSKSTIKYILSMMEKTGSNNEMKGLLEVLNGKYLQAKLAGDTIRNPEVLPSGYNLFQFDPRFIPTRAAWKRGFEIAENTLKKYKEDQGEYPQSTAVILWGLETSRTQGETVGQILGYLGVRLKKMKNAWEPAYEIIPPEELNRPRIDVVINICGFFRDMFPNIIEELNKILKEISLLHEGEESNYFIKNSNRIYEELLKKGYDKIEAEELSRARIFGPGEGEYGTGISKLIETKNWEREEQIGEAYIKSLKHVYSENFRGRESEELFGMNLMAVDIVSQIRSNHEYEVTDLDHYYEYFGGLSKSVEMVKGKKAAIYITDTTGRRIETDRVEKSIEMGVRTRLLNPKWIDGMLEHKYHGVQKISDRFENILGLAATTNKVENWVFSKMHSTYVSDEELRNRMIENNPWAYHKILESLMEYNQRGYWKATQEELLELREEYLKLEGNIEEKL